MLLIRCSSCRTKLWKYNKLGKGEVLRCHKTRISRMLKGVETEGGISCPCGQAVGIDKGTYYKMIRSAFTYSGTKVSRLPR